MGKNANLWGETEKPLGCICSERHWSLGLRFPGCNSHNTQPKKSDFEAALDYTLDEVRKVMIDRHAKYGPGNILRHGLMGVVVRLGDKYERLDNNRDQDFADESVDDTILDIIGYGLIAKLLREQAWPGQNKV